MTEGSSASGAKNGDKVLFWGCFVALVATAFGFIVRVMIIGDWQAEFGLDETEKGELLGVGLWPFAISIVVFSLIIDRVGYGKAMLFALVCHVSSAVITIFADGYDMLYVGTLIVALGNGTVEAFINPVVATMFRRDKTKWLNILHAGWPGGLVLGGLMALGMGAEMDWRYKVGLILIPTVVYAAMLFRRKFPVHERVAAGVGYRDMLREVGFLGALVVVSLIALQIGSLLGWELWVILLASVLVSGAFGGYVQSLGRPLFALLLVIMVPLATTELGTDSWISDLMTPQMQELGLEGGWVLVYTSFIMMVLRFFAGPIVHRISPLGLLATSALVAVVGLLALSQAAGVTILLAATLFACGKTFFWPTMLGLAAEQFPKGGALSLNIVGGVGMLGVGVLGSVYLGWIQDTRVNAGLLEHDRAQGTALHRTYVSESKGSVFGEYAALDMKKVESADQATKAVIAELGERHKKSTLSTTALFPALILAGYLGLILYFKSRGGYRAVQLD